MTKETARNGGTKHLAKQLLAGFVLCLLVAVGGLSFVKSSRAAVSPPNILSYQGRLLNSNGVPVADASIPMVFELYTAASGGSCLWSNSSATCATSVARTVVLTDGLFAENLGDTAASTPYAAIADSVFADNASVYLQITVNGEAFTTRRQILAAPYALNSETLDGYSSSQAGGTTAFVPVTDSTGNLQLTGNPSGSAIGNGSLYLNPAILDTAANDNILGIALGGVTLFSVDAEGDSVIIGDLTVGTASLVAPFSVDESLNLIRIGDGVSDANDPTITFYASNGTDSGSLSFLDEDRFNFANGNITFNGLGVMPTVASGSENEFLALSTFGGTSGAGLGTIEMYGSGSSTTYSAIENGVGTDHFVGAQNSLLTLTGGTTTVTKAFGLRSRLINSSTNASLVQGSGYLTALESEFSQNAAATVAEGYGVRGISFASAGTVTKAVGTYGAIGSSVGTVTSGYGGEFISTAAGATRYGIYAEASGGATANYSGYFTGARMQVDDNSTADVPTYAIAAGDLFVSDVIESDGSLAVGDGVGADQILFSSGVTTQNGVSMAMNGLTNGTGMAVTRGDDGGATTFDGTLISLSVSDASAGSGDVLSLTNSGGANSVGLYITQYSTSAHVADLPGNNAVVIDVNELGSSDDAIILRSNVTGGAATVFRVTTEGNAYVDGAFTGGGADFAEYFPSSDASLDDHHLVCQNTAASKKVVICAAGNTEPMGVVSTNPAFIGNSVGDGTEDYRDDTRYRLVGLVGQIDTYVNADEGAISIGDPITTSTLVAGYGAKAHGPVRIIGFALEPKVSGRGLIKVLVQPQWYGGDVLTSQGGAVDVSSDLVLSPAASASADVQGVDSHSIAFRGAAWNGSSSAARAMSISTTVSTADDYRMVVRNNEGTEVAYVSNTGDLSLSGRFYPSDRGTSQHSRYLYYDGSSGSGGDFMRTNASGWATGSYDFAEMFPSPDALSPGEVVVFGDANEAVKRSPDETYNQRIAGVVSTRPGFLAGENLSGHYPVALAGRVPTYVTGENGAINIGDPLTTSSRPGYAMKATEAGPIIGYATQAFSGTVGSIVTFINVSYYDGGPAEEGPAANNVVSGLATQLSSFDISGSLNMNGGNLLSIGSLEGISNNWRLEENGDLITHGRLIQLVRSFQGEDVETYAAASRQMTVELSGTVMLDKGTAAITFEQIDPQYNDIISPLAPYKVLLTPYGATGTLYVAERNSTGFIIREVGGSSGVMVDWLVIAPHKDYEPVVTNPVVEENEIVSEETTSIESQTDNTSEEQIEQPVVILPVTEEVVVDSSEQVDPLTPDTSTDESTIVTIPEVSQEPIADPLLQTESVYDVEAE